MEINFSQEIYFSNKKKLSLSEIANSLIALENVSILSTQVLTNLYKDTLVEKMEVSIDTLETGSLKETIQYYFKLAIQKNVEGALGNNFPNMENLKDEKRNSIIAWVMVASIFYGIKIGSDKLFPDKPKEHINNEINIVLNTGKNLTGIEEDKLREVLEKISSENPSLPKNAIDFSKPAKKDPEASIDFNNEYKITKEFLKESPSSVLDEEIKEKTLEYINTEIHIRATDKDSGNKGWGAIIPEFSEKRIRLNIGKNIDLDYLSYQELIIGNVAVFYTVDQMGNIQKPHAYLYGVQYGSK